MKSDVVVKLGLNSCNLMGGANNHLLVDYDAGAVSAVFLANDAEKEKKNSTASEKESEEERSKEKDAC